MNGNLQPLGPDELAEHAGFLKLLARSLLSDQGRADDAVQDALLVTMRRQPILRSPRAWLTTVTRNAVRRVVRMERRRARYEMDATPPETPESLLDAAERMEAAEGVIAVVRALPEPYLHTIVGLYFDQKSAAELAGEEGIPPGTVRSRHHRALDMLRSALDQSHGGNRRAWAVPLLPLLTETRKASIGASSFLLGATIVGNWAKIGVVVFLLLTIGVGLLWLDNDSEPELAPPGPPAEGASREVGGEARTSPPQETADGARAGAPPIADEESSPGATRVTCRGTLTYEDGTPAPDEFVFLHSLPESQVKTNQRGELLIRTERERNSPPRCALAGSLPRPDPSDGGLGSPMPGTRDWRGRRRVHRAASTGSGRRRLGAGLRGRADYGRAGRAGSGPCQSIR